MALENNFSDIARGNVIDAFPVMGYIMEGQLEPEPLKSALEHVIQRVPVLRARMCRNGK